MRTWLQLWENPLFTQRFLDFFGSMQTVGMEAARRSWAANYSGDSLYGNAADFFEKMIAFYSNLGFVPQRQHDEVVAENERLKKENELLKRTLTEMNLKVFSEGSLKAQQLWQEIAQKQIEMGTEIAKEYLGGLKNRRED